MPAAPSATTTARTKIGFIGAGNISGRYASSLARHPELHLVGVVDIDRDRARALAEDHSCAAYDSLADLLAAGVEIVVNLTSAPFHYQTTRELVELGVAVFSEKPLALRPQEAHELVELATARGVRVGCAPSLWLGRSYQDVARRVRAGAIGEVRLCTAEVHQGRIERWHPAPASFFQVGPVVDAGVYPLTYLTALFGPIREVSAVSARLLPERRTVEGIPFEITAADAWYVTATFDSGQVLRLSCDFYVGSKTAPRVVEFHGDDGSIRLGDWVGPDAEIASAGVGEAYSDEPAREPIELDWTLGVLDLASAIREGRPHRTSIEHAAHIVDVLDAIARSAEARATVTVRSSFPDPFTAHDLMMERA